MKNIILCLISFSFLMSTIHINGDARIRPRYDIKENGDNSSTSDFYFLYRARLNVKADIGEGWFFKTKLGTSSVAGMSKMGSDGDGPGLISSYRPNLSFMELYFGNMSDNWGFWAGVLPLKYNPILDLHFYSDKLIDIPFMLFNNSATTGFSGYRNILNHKLNWFLSVDNNIIDNEETIAETNIIEEHCSNYNFLDEDACEDAGHQWFDEQIENIEALTIISDDNYTLGTDMFLTFGSVSFNPRVLTSFGGSEDSIFPITYGTDILLPEFAGFSSSFSYYLSVKGNEEDEEYYQADHMRISFNRPIKGGKLKFFYDIASKSYFNLEIDEFDNEVSLNHKDKVSYMWLSYTYSFYKGDMGEVTISPTFRLQNGKGPGTDSFDENYSRAKFEVTAQIKFN